MKRLLCLVMTLTNVAAAAEQDNLTGTWNVVKAEEDGKPSNDLTKAKLTFKNGDKLLIQLANEAKPLEVTVKLDATKTPKQIDLTATTDGRQETALGIYERDGDKLKLCVAEPEVKQRPTEFKSKSRKVTYVELTREKP